MAKHSNLRGHPIIFDGDEWIYCDTKEPTIGSSRPCGRCEQDRTSEGHDACLGTLPDVVNACCGHGDDKTAYVILLNGDRLALAELQRAQLESPNEPS